MLKNKSLIPIRLGRLLQAAGIVNPASLTTALHKARASRRRIGEVLSECGMLREPVLIAALEAQKLVRESALSFDMSVEAVKVVQAHGIGLQHALKRLGWQVENACDTSQLLTHLLMAAGAANRVQLEQARWVAQKKQLTFGRALVLEGGVAPKLMVSAFDSLVLIRDGRLTPRQAVEALTRVRIEGIQFQDALETPPYPVARMGELLTLSGILTDADVLDILEVALLEQKRLGEVLLRSELVSPLVVDAALRTQALISEHFLSLSDGIDLLRTVHEQQRSLETIVREMIGIRLQAVGLLHQLLLISDAELFEAGKILERLGDPMMAFALNGRMNGYILQTAIDCSIRMHEGRLSHNEALRALQYCSAGNCTLEAYIDQLELAELRKLFTDQMPVARSA